MVETKTIAVTSVLGIILLLSIVSTGKYTTCSKGSWTWLNETHAQCSTNNKIAFCYSISKTKCYLGKEVDLPCQTFKLFYSSNEFTETRIVSNDAELNALCRKHDSKTCIGEKYTYSMECAE